MGRKIGLFLLGCFFCFVSSKSQETPIQIEIDYKTPNWIHFICNNYTATDYFVNIHFPILKGYQSKKELPYQTIVKPGKTTVLSLKKIRDFEKPTFKYTYSYTKGRTLSTIQLDYVYSLPIKQGDSIEVETLQSIDEFSNRELNENLYGVLFSMNKGDTVYAAREGVVSSVNDIEMKNDRRRYNFKARNNKIELFHTDGTFTRYSSLDAVLVEPGDKINLGQAIAVVGGRSFYSSKEHVRFLVYYLDSVKVQNLSSRTKYSLLTPVFDTKNFGKVKLVRKNVYVKPIYPAVIPKKNK